MSPVLTRTFLYIVVLLMGYVGKRTNLFRTSDSRFLSSLIFWRQPVIKTIYSFKQRCKHMVILS